MLGKKLLTVACALGILALGACFGPVGEYRPPRPPMNLFTGIQTVRVVITNSSPSHYLDPAVIQRDVVTDFNISGNQTNVHAVIEGDGDSTLTLDVAEEDAHQIKGNAGGKSASWQFHAVGMAKLTNREGQVLWADPNWNVSYTRAYYDIQKWNITPGWSDVVSRNRFNENLADQLFHQIAFQ
jgi:hypothetical protein